MLNLCSAAKTLQRNTFSPGPRQTLRNRDGVSENRGAEDIRKWSTGSGSWLVNRYSPRGITLILTAHFKVSVFISVLQRKWCSERLSNLPKITQKRNGKWGPKSWLTLPACAFSGMPCYLKSSVYFLLGGSWARLVSKETEDLVPAWGHGTKHLISYLYNESVELDSS